jgi:hypothetical protein
MDMVRPCAKCPFRTDVEPYLTCARVREIEMALTRQQATFTCHETTVPSDGDDGEMIDGPNAQHCAGALILMEKLNRPNQLMRIYERLGGYDRTKLKMDAPVFDTFAAMRRAQER